MYYVNFLDFNSLLKILKIKKTKKIKKIYYLHISKNFLFKKILNLIPNCKFLFLNVELRHSEELQSSWIETKLKKTEYIKFKKYIDKKINSNDIENFKNYLVKYFLSEFDKINNNDFKKIIIFLNKVKFHKKKNNIKNELVFLNNNIWIDFYDEYSKSLNLNILNIINNKFTFTNLYVVSKKIFKEMINYLINFNIEKKNKSSFDKQFIRVGFENLGEINFENDYHNSDLFFNFNKLINNRNIAVEYVNKKEKNEIINHGMKPYKIYFNSFIREIPKYIFFNNLTKYENSRINILHKNYKNEINLWSNIFSKNNIKIYLSWNKFNSKHIPIYEALNKLDSTLAIWERSFEGVPSPELTTISDILFKTGKINLLNDDLNNNKNKFKIIVGFLRDYNIKKSKIVAEKIKNQLYSHGAKKIISLFDQNSSDNFMHKNQSDFYIYFLNLILKNKDYALVIKPKKSKTIFSRFGNEFKEIYNEALKTNRIYLFNSSGKSQSNVSINTAALCSDLCVHSNLYAGTASIECALSGIPTILLDRENDKENILNNMELNNVIFKNINDLEVNINEFLLNKKFYILGDWSKEFDNMDPFRDGKGHKRLNWFLNQMLTGYEKGLSKEEILYLTSKEYAILWGKDKVINK